MAISFAKARMGFFRLKDKTYLINIFGNRYPFVEVSFLTSNQALDLLMNYSSLPKILHVFDAASALLAVFLVGIILLRTVRSRGGFKLPPGPKPLPLVGNLFDLPRDHDWVHWAKHAELYGT